MILAISTPHYMHPEEMNQCLMSKLARSDEPKVNQVQMKSKAQSEKCMILYPFVKGPNVLTLSHLSFI